MRLHRIAASAALLAAATPLLAQNYRIEGAVVDSRSAQNLGVVTETGQLSNLFRAQKAVTFGILRSAGISLDQLPPDVRARIERFQTENVEAFRAFSEGLDLRDKGRFVEAKAQFRRAAELDPSFALAREQAQAMPDSNVGTSVELRALLAAVAGTAVDRAKASVVVDAQRAVAALAAGLQVTAVSVPAAERRAEAYTVNAPGSSNQFQPNIVAGYAYQQRDASTGNLPVGVAAATEWRADAYLTRDGVLESLGSRGDFLALRSGVALVPGSSGSAELADGSLAYWGSWATPAAGVSSVSSGSKAAGLVSPFSYVFGNATTQMPTSSTVQFEARTNAGSLSSATGSISVNFASQQVNVNNLGFSIGDLSYAGLNGSARYAVGTGVGTASGSFLGGYSSGSCSNCGPAFDVTAGKFAGSFIGRDASGLVYSTVLPTGFASIPTVSGVQLFLAKKP